MKQYRAVKFSDRDTWYIESFEHPISHYLEIPFRSREEAEKAITEILIETIVGTSDKKTIKDNGGWMKVHTLDIPPI